MARPGALRSLDAWSDLHLVIAENTARRATQIINPNSAHASTEPKAQGARARRRGNDDFATEAYPRRTTLWLEREARRHGVGSLKSGGSADSRERRHLPLVATIP